MGQTKNRGKSLTNTKIICEHWSDILEANADGINAAKAFFASEAENWVSNNGSQARRASLIKETCATLKERCSTQRNNYKKEIEALEKGDQIKALFLLELLSLDYLIEELAEFYDRGHRQHDIMVVFATPMPPHKAFQALIDQYIMNDEGENRYTVQKVILAKQKEETYTEPSEDSDDTSIERDTASPRNAVKRHSSNLSLTHELSGSPPSSSSGEMGKLGDSPLRNSATRNKQPLKIDTCKANLKETIIQLKICLSQMGFKALEPETITSIESKFNGMLAALSAESQEKLDRALDKHRARRTGSSPKLEKQKNRRSGHSPRHVFSFSRIDVHITDEIKPDDTPEIKDVLQAINQHLTMFTTQLNEFSNANITPDTANSNKQQMHEKMHCTLRRGVQSFGRLLNEKIRTQLLRRITAQHIADVDTSPSISRPASRATHITESYTESVSASDTSSNSSNRGSNTSYSGSPTTSTDNSEDESENLFADMQQLDAEGFVSANDRSMSTDDTAHKASFSHKRTTGKLRRPQGAGLHDQSAARQQQLNRQNATSVVTVESTVPPHQPGKTGNA